MKTSKVSFALAALMAASLGLAGCSAAGSDSTSAGAPCADISTEETLGSVESAGLVEDAEGAYCGITTDAFVEQWFKSYSEAPAAVTSQFSEDELAQVQRAAVKFAAEETLDSEFLDTFSGGIDRWFEEHSVSQELTQAISADMDRAFVAGALPVLERDGLPRGRNYTLVVEEVRGGSGATGEPTLTVRVLYRADFVADGQAAVEFIRDSPVSPYTADQKERILADLPVYKGDSTKVVLNLDGAIELTYTKGSLEQLTDANSSWTLQERTENYIDSLT